jgi:hypothetical protein
VVCLAGSARFGSAVLMGQLISVEDIGNPPLRRGFSQARIGTVLRRVNRGVAVTPILKTHEVHRVRVGHRGGRERAASVVEGGAVAGQNPQVRGDRG